jgi:hypothetical protein
MDTLKELQVFAEISEVLDEAWIQDTALNRVCQAAVEILDVQHSGVVVFDEQLEVGSLRAEYPESFLALNASFSIRNIPAGQDLIHRNSEIYYPDLGSPESQTGLGPRRDELWGLGIRGVLIVPVFVAGKVIGWFSLDSTRGPREFSEAEKAKCRLLSSFIGTTLQSIYLASVAEEIATGLLTDMPPDHVESRIVDMATRLMNADLAELRWGDQSGLASPALIRSPLRGVHEIAWGIGPPKRPICNLVLSFVKPRQIIAADVRKLEYLSRYAYIALDRARILRRQILLRRLGDIFVEEKEPERALHEIAFLVSKFFESSLCRIVAADIRNVPLHNIAADSKGAFGDQEQNNGTGLLTILPVFYPPSPDAEPVSLSAGANAGAEINN